MNKFEKFILAPKSILDRISKYDQSLVNVDNLIEKDINKERIQRDYEKDPIKSSIENSINSRELWAAKKQVFSEPFVDTKPEEKTQTEETTKLEEKAEEKQLEKAEQKKEEKTEERLNESHSEQNQHYPSKDYIYETLNSIPKTQFEVRSDGVIIENGRAIDNSNIMHIISHITRTREGSQRLGRVTGQKAVLRALASVEGLNLDRVSLRNEIRSEIDSLRNVEEFYDISDLPVKLVD